MTWCCRSHTGISQAPTMRSGCPAAGRPRRRDVLAPLTEALRDGQAEDARLAHDRGVTHRGRSDARGSLGAPCAASLWGWRLTISQTAGHGSDPRRASGGETAHFWPAKAIAVTAPR